MNKEEIYERYWKQLLQVRRIYASNRADSDNMYVYYKVHAERDRDRLLKKHGHEPFVSG